jgi:hypothetical protein
MRRLNQGSILSKIGIARRRNDRGIVWTKRRGRVADGQRAIVLVCPDMREDPTIGVIGQRVVALVDYDKPKGLRQPL